MKRHLVLAVTAVLILSLAIAVPSFAGSSPPSGVTVVRVTATGGGPPKYGTPGATSTSKGSLTDSSGASSVGSWTYRCTYLDRRGQRKITHYCSLVLSFTGKGEITIGGALREDSSEEQWFAVTGATGRYHGKTGVARLVNWNTPRTDFTLYLVKR